MPAIPLELRTSEIQTITNLGADFGVTAEGMIRSLPKIGSVVYRDIRTIGLGIDMRVGCGFSNWPENRHALVGLSGIFAMTQAIIEPEYSVEGDDSSKARDRRVEAIEMTDEEIMEMRAGESFQPHHIAHFGLKVLVKITELADMTSGLSRPEAMKEIEIVTRRLEKKSENGEPRYNVLGEVELARSEQDDDRVELTNLKKHGRFMRFWNSD